MIDCGFTAWRAFHAQYQREPDSIFITHLHADHIGGLEGLFYRLRFRAQTNLCKLFVPAPLIAALHAKVGEYPGILAEGGSNFWDVFQLIPVGTGFWHQDVYFDVHPVRHHAPMSAYAVAVKGVFFFTGDTRPIPELLAHHASAGELIFHDLSVQANPSHTGLADIRREYPESWWPRLRFYHLGSALEADAMRAEGLIVAEKGECFALMPGRDR
jgi:glyoxylase-like metal-dependent hydrolase (beta-lactamase superfamily II)